MLTDLKTLIERFANSTSMDDLFESINVIYSDADKDPELKGWFRHMDTYIRKCLKEQGYVLQDSATNEWNKLYDQGHFLFRERYRNHVDRISDELNFYADQFNKDPQNTSFANAVQKLFLDLGNDENGQTTFKPHLLKDLSDVIIPGIFENIRYVPIPRIEYSDHMIDAVVENLVLEGDNLAPNVMEFGSDNYWRWGRKSIANKNKNKVMLSVSGVQCDLRDVSYYLKKKEGFPGITDKGVMDIFLGGTGLSFKVAMETADKSDRSHFFKVNTVHVDIQNMKIKLKQSNHKLLFGLFKPLLLKVMRPVIQKVVEKQIRDNIHQLDGMLYQVKKEADRAEAEAKRNPDPENIQNIYQRYASAANAKLMKGKQKKDEVASDKTVNVAMTKHDSIFKNISLPGGISTKATEYKDLAAKGDKWESPIFSLGSARETSSLPKIASVSRKPHRVNKEGIRGPNNLGGSYQGAGFDGSSDLGPSGNSSGRGSSNTGGAGYSNNSSSAGYDSNTTGTGYGNSGYGSSNTGAGYGTSGNTGYSGTSNTAGVGGQVPTHGVSGYDNNSSGFGNQVDDAFNSAEQIQPTTTSNVASGGTFFGAHNPVFDGRA